jgi:hypothetical protein
LPNSWPGNQASSTAGTSSAHGNNTGAPASPTTTVRGLTARTRRISSSCRCRPRWIPPASSESSA